MALCSDAVENVHVALFYAQFQGCFQRDFGHRGEDHVFKKGYVMGDFDLLHGLLVQRYEADECEPLIEHLGIIPLGVEAFCVRRRRTVVDP